MATSKSTTWALGAVLCIAVLHLAYSHELSRDVPLKLREVVDTGEDGSGGDSDAGGDGGPVGDGGGDGDDGDEDVDDSHVVNHSGVPHAFKKAEAPDVHQTSYEQEMQAEEKEKELLQRIKEYQAQHPGAPPPDISTLDSDSIQEGTQSTRKRFVEGSSKKRWTKGVVPYIFTADITPSKGHEIQVAMTRIEKYTCIRFVPWNDGTARAKYGLDHDGYVKFMSRNGCWAVQGNSRSKKGQSVSCCGRGTCTHELGHVLGVYHEHQNPESFGWIRVNWENIKLNYQKWYTIKSPKNVITYGYDISSIMHYGDWAFNSNGGKTLTLLFPELRIGSNYFYQFHEMVESHGCKALRCPDFTMECENEGYVTVINDQCSCMCPYGLERTTGCTTTVTQATTTDSWAGNFAMLAPTDGCPGDVFSEGEVTHWSRGGSWESSSFHLKGNYNSESTNMHFCVMENNTNSATWPEGRYCIHRAGGQCPSGFEEGYVQFDDVIRSAEKNNSNLGTIPDGVYNKDTLYYFCCRDDGFRSEPMEIANKHPLVLYRYKDNCQEVKGMIHVSEYYVFRNYNSDDANVTSFGAVPKYWKGGDQRYYTYFCYYRPVTMDCGGVYELNDDNPSVTIVSPNYPNLYASDTECNWLIKAPKNTTILVNFDTLDIEQSGTICKDSLEVRHSRIGQNGIKYCGEDMKESIRSIYNMVSMTFRSNSQNNKKGFNLTASYIKPEDHCYDMADFGRTYRGQVNFTRDMQPCLPWAEVPSCPYHAFDTRYIDDGLDGNFCRNPGSGLRPWCYTGIDAKKGCVRNYCDVCLKENRYDHFDDCEDIKTNDNFCSEDPQAFKGCALTCSDVLPSVPQPTQAFSQITCVSPTIPSDGVQVTPTKTSYKLGDTVQVRCSVSNETVKSTCLTDGSWSLGNYICGVCPDGWNAHDDYCFKYFTENLNYDQATARCGEFGSILAPTKTAEEMNYVLSLRTYLKKIWLGADDKQTEGVWVWQDGTNVTWSNWKDKQPDNWNNEDCAVIDREDALSIWNDVYCTWYNNHNFVCRKKREESTTCMDRKDDCVDLFNNDPRICKQHPDFVSQECPFTCGLCGDVTDATCTPTTANNAGVTTEMGQTMTRGETISYACTSGYVLTEGNLHRGCQSNGQLTGNAPVCKDINDIETPSNDVELKSRKTVGSNKRTYIGNVTEFIIPKAGEITQWNFYSKYAGDVALQVYRPTGEEFKYQFIGQNALRSRDERVQYAKIVTGERIQVASGDIIGVYYGYSRGGLPYDYCDNSKGLSFKTSTSYKNSALFKIGGNYTFSSSSARCRVFSVTAIVGPVQG